MPTSTNEVSQTLEELPASFQPDQPGIRELLTELQRVTTAEGHLPDRDRDQVLSQIKNLAHIWKEKETSTKKKEAVIAVEILQRIVAEVPEAEDFNETATNLIPQIAGIFGVIE